VRTANQFVGIGLLLVCLSTVGIAQEQVRVIRDRTTIWRNATGSSGVLTVVRAGTVLTVVGRQNRYLIVDVPNLPGQRGYILEQLTEAVTDQPPEQGREPATPSGAPRQPPRAPAPPGANSGRAAGQTANRRPPPKPRLTNPNFVYGALSLQASKLDFSALTETPTLYEQEVHNTEYGVPRWPGFEAGGGRWLSPRLFLAGMLVQRWSSEDARVAALIPSPVFYGQPRSLAGTLTSDRSETALHGQIGFSIVQTRRFQLNASGGPSFFIVAQQLLTSVSYTEQYPYDAVTFVSATPTKETAQTFGANAELSALMPLTKRLALQTSGRWAFGKVAFSDAGSVSSLVGAGQVGVGVRYRF